MTNGRDLRPDAETFEYAGCRVTVVEPADILAVARTQRVELLHGATFPAPVAGVRFSVASAVRDGRPVHLLDAEIHTVDAAPAPDRLGPAVFSVTAPVGALLVRRLAAVDPQAGRVVGRVGAAAAAAYRRLGLDRNPEPASDLLGEGGHTRTVAVGDADDRVELQAAVNFDGAPPPGGARTATVRAAVPSDTVSPAHLRAMFGLVLQVVDEIHRAAGSPGVAGGRSYVLSRYPGGRPAAVPDTEHVSLDQVGGLPEVVGQFRQIAVSFRHPQAMARWGARRPQGILMYGPPGTGKTMLARALANEIGGSFREVRTPEILDKWLGGSERNIKQIFRAARRYHEPTVLLFDEFDSIISYAADGHDAASQAVNAVAGIFKQEMNDLIEDNPNVIVVATTNFPHRVDDSLIRSGRFDIKIAVPLPDEAGRAEILTKVIRQLIAAHEVPGFRMFADDVDPGELARAAPGMTGADLKEVLRRVQLDKAMQEARTGAVSAPISQDDLMRGITQLSRTPRAM